MRSSGLEGGRSHIWRGGLIEERERLRGGVDTLAFAVALRSGLIASDGGFVVRLKKEIHLRFCVLFWDEVSEMENIIIMSLGLLTARLL